MHIGFTTQLGFLMMVMGLMCAIKPYQTAKWHKNDPKMQEREHKRAQSRRRKKNRIKFDAGMLGLEQEPSGMAVHAVRVLGWAILLGGAALTVWSLL